MPARSRRPRRLGRFVVDYGALRESPAFRRLFTGQLVSLIGRQITVVAVPFQVYQLTGSPALLGLIGLAQAVPLVLLGLVAGVLSDRFDRRRILLVTQTLLALTSLGLAVGAIAGRPPVLVIFLLVAVSAGVSAIENPTRAAIVPNLVSRRRLSGALSLNFGLFQLGLLAGPAIGGIVIGRFGLPVAFLIDVATYGASLTAAALLPPQRPEGGGHEPPLRALRSGFSFLRRQPVIMGGFAADLAAMIFGMPKALFPVLAATTFHTGPSGLGLLYSAPGAGALVAAASAGWLSNTRHLGRVVVVSVAVWGVAIIGLGFAPALVPALALLAVAGFADSCSAVSRNTMAQTLTPDSQRGRMSAVYNIVVVGGNNLGDLESGMVAAAFGAEISVVSGGFLCLLGLAAGAAAFPALWRYRHATVEAVLPEGPAATAGDAASEHEAAP